MSSVLLPGPNKAVSAKLVTGLQMKLNIEENRHKCVAWIRTHKGEIFGFKIEIKAAEKLLRTFADGSAC